MGHRIFTGCIALLLLTCISAFAREITCDHCGKKYSPDSQNHNCPHETIDNAVGTTDMAGFVGCTCNEESLVTMTGGEQIALLDEALQGSNYLIHAFQVQALLGRIQTYGEGYQSESFAKVWSFMMGAYALYLLMHVNNVPIDGFIIGEASTAQDSVVQFAHYLAASSVRQPVPTEVSISQEVLTAFTAASNAPVSINTEIGNILWALNCINVNTSSMLELVPLPHISLHKLRFVVIRLPGNRFILITMRGVVNINGNVFLTANQAADVLRRIYYYYYMHLNPSTTGQRFRAWADQWARQRLGPIADIEINGHFVATALILFGMTSIAVSITNENTGK